MSHIHFVGGEKGGVGKSVVARVLAQWFIDRSVPFTAVDADRSHGALLRTYRDFTHPVDLSLIESADQIMDLALTDDRRVLVDLPAQSTHQLESWMAGADVMSFAEENNVQLSYWHVSDSGFASVAELDRVLSVFDDELSYFVVKNYGRSKDFSQFDGSSAKRLLEARAGTVIELEELEASVMYKIDRLGASFWAAIHTSDGPFALRPLERRRAKLWLARAHAALDDVQDRL